MGSGEAETVRTHVPDTGKDIHGKWIMRCGTCKGGLYAWHELWLHALPMHCKETLPYKDRH